jgi:hypothetical protein
VLAALATAIALLVAACRKDAGGAAPTLTAARVIELHADSLMAIPGVVGVYEGRSHGKTVIRVMLAAKADSTLRKLPQTLAGYAVETEVTGKLEPMHR